MVIRKRVNCIITTSNSAKYLLDAVNSVVCQTIGYDNINLVIVDDGSTDNTEESILKLQIIYPDIVYIAGGKGGLSTARNVGLKFCQTHSKAIYTFFMHAEDYIDINLFERGIALLQRYQGEVDFVAFPIEIVGEDKTILKASEETSSASRIVKIRGGKNKYTHGTSCCFFASEEIDDLYFDKELRMEEGKFLEGSVFVSKLLRHKEKYALDGGAKCYYRRAVKEIPELDDIAHSPEWYNRIFSLGRHLIDEELTLYGHVTRHTQYLVMHDLQWYNLPKIPDSIQEELDITATFEEFKRIIAYMDDDFIRGQKQLSYWQKIYLLEVKHGPGKLVESEETSEPYFEIGGVPRDGVSPVVRIRIAEEYGGIITFSGTYYVVDKEQVELVAIYNDAEYTCRFHDIDHTSIHYLGCICYKACVFDLSIPFTGEGVISFRTKVKGYGLYPVTIKAAYYSRMCDEPGAFVLGDETIVFRLGESSFRVISLNDGALVKKVNDYIQKNLTSDRFAQDVELLQSYLEQYDEMAKRRIWMFMDRTNKADDNAEHLFRYCASIDDGIEKYFVLKEDSPDVPRMQDVGKVVFFGSKQHKLLHLFAEKYISASFSYPDVFPFGTDRQINIFKGLSRAKFMFLQHGIILHDLSSYLHKWKRNFKLFVTTTKGEYNSILHKEYGYCPNVVKLTGLPRYDGLKSNTKKQIVFIFTWRRNLAKYAPGQHIGCIYNPKFKESEYYKGINNILSDKELLDTAQEHGYELVFRPHPEIYVQMEDFSFDERVTIAPQETSYQKLYAEGALAITDYSSAIFDFAYLKKPIIYYHFDANHYNSGYFDYEKMGFGEVITDSAQMIQAIVTHIKSGCVMPDEYQQRVDDFFTYTDIENCRRVYNEIITK